MGRWDARFALVGSLLSPGIFPETGERAVLRATGPRPVENSVDFIMNRPFHPRLTSL